MAQTTGARYEVLSDVSHKVLMDFGVLNAAERGGIAHPSVFIIDTAGLIRYSYVGKDPSDRPAEDTLLNEVKKVVDGK